MVVRARTVGCEFEHVFAVLRAPGKAGVLGNA